jgi:L-seryl-tRNA(Ser) seleniumtransferase
MIIRKMKTETPDNRTALPAVGEMLGHPLVVEWLQVHPRTVVLDAIRRALADWRERLRTGGETAVDAERLLADMESQLRKSTRPALRPVINATGVVIHTNLGRSVLAGDVAVAVFESCFHYLNLEYDLEAGRRGTRESLVEKLLCDLTGAEAALAVNNNAGAVLLALSALAAGREVIVSRGELIEIGGSFRLPDILAQSGARLVEVGTTNRTHLPDYERAITERTALLMKVHPSNFRQVGFTSEVSGGELADLAHWRGLTAVEDLGSGSLVPTAELGLPHEPTAPEAIRNSLDLVTFSGDKLLGGPQAGILIGKTALVQACAKHPLYRALRLDKLTLAALEATLRLYRDPAYAMEQIPTLRMLRANGPELLQRAKRLATKLRQATKWIAVVEIIETTGAVGGGALPLAELPGPALAIRSQRMSANALARALRHVEKPIIVRVEQDHVIADPRTVLPAEERAFLAGMVAALTGEADRE